MNNLIIAPTIMTVLGLFFGIVLAVVYRFLKVRENPRVEALEDILPGSNCGACGEPGCRAFAEKLMAKTLAPSRCTVSNQETVESIAE